MPSTINTNLNSKSDRKKPLTDKSIQAIKPREDGKERKIFDNHPDYPGLYIATSKTARKVFRLKCRFQGKDILLTLGQYPAMTLKLAREKALLSLQHIAEGMNPAEAKRLEKTKEPDTFSIGLTFGTGKWLLRGVRCIAKMSGGTNLICTFFQSLVTKLSRTFRNATMNLY